MDTQIIKSSTFRLALIYMSFFIISVLLILILIYWSTVTYLTNQTDIVINSEIKNLVSRYEHDGLNGLSLALNERLSRRPTGLSVYLLTDRNLIPILGNLDRWPLNAKIETGWLNFKFDIKEKSAIVSHSARAKIFRLRGNLMLLVGRDINELDTIIKLIVETLLASLFVMLVLAAIGSMLLSRYTVRRIGVINQASQEIMSGTLVSRIPDRGTGDEFDTLAGNLNSMLDRIESLMESVKHVSDKIAHDLRTPLTHIRNHLEELLLEADRPHHHRVMIEQAITEADGLLSSFNALLRIARLESQDAINKSEPVNIVGLCRDVIELYEPLIEQKGQRLETEIMDVEPIKGDRDMLFQAISNLIDNAIKYTPENGLLQVLLKQNNSVAKLIIADSGPGIPVQEREKVFERFFRQDQSRNTPGNGLGLSLVNAVIKLHKMDIHLEDNHPGLKVVIVFPQK